MSEFVRPHYRNAPIAEALIDFRVAHPDSITMEQLTEAADALAGDFPVRLPMNQIEFGFDLEAGQTRNDQAQVGWRLATQAQDRVLQLQRIGFTYSHLPPYTNWDTFRDEARFCWNVFRLSVAQTEINRVAVRVINRIPTPQAEIALEEYLSIYPVVPPEMPATASAVFVQLQLALPKVLPEARVIINVASGRSDASGTHLVLDIDMFATGLFEGDDPVWAAVEKFGVEKDVIFESCITDKVREVIQ